MCKKKGTEELAVIRLREIESGLVTPVKSEELFGDECKKEIECIEVNKTGGITRWKN